MSFVPLRLLVAGTAMLASFEVAAVELTFSLYPTGNNNPNVASQFTVDVSAFGVNQVLFKLENNGSIQSTITDVLFYDGSLLGIASLRDMDDMIGASLGLSTVDFTAGVVFNPDKLPQYPTASFGTDRDSGDGVGNGVDTTEYLEILFNLKAGTTFANLLAELQSGKVFMGLHVQSIGGDDGGSDWFKSNPTTPNDTPAVPDGGTTVILLGVALLGMGALRRKFAH